MALCIHDPPLLLLKALIYILGDTYIYLILGILLTDVLQWILFLSPSRIPSSKLASGSLSSNEYLTILL